MTELVKIDSDRFGAMEKVADYKYLGWNDTLIAKELGVQRKIVIELYNDYKDMLLQDSEARDIARDHLYAMGQHYDRLIKKLYELVDEMNSEIGVSRMTHQWAAQIQGAYKNIADLEAKRLDAYQKAGLLENSELGDELAEIEEQAATLISILRTDLCEDCRTRVQEKMQKATGMVEVVIPV